MNRVPLYFLAAMIFGQSLANASYEVKRGDTLTEIAESKYGNWIKWHNLWDVNRKRIPDPNLIYPGQRLQLLTDEELDFYASNDGSGSNKRSASDADGPTRLRRSRHGQEWRLLPLQSWEKYVFKTDPQIDPDGFDRRSKVAARVSNKSTADVTIASDRIPGLGEIINARTEYQRIFLGEQIFVRADEQLQVGTVYSVTTGPQKMVSKRDGRVGFGYDLTGKIKIIGVRDGLFIGTVVALYHPIERHQLLIPEVGDYHFIQAVAAPNPIAAIVLAPQSYRQDMLAEQKIVFLDVGSSDGARPGMIFRHYLHTDPGTNETITTKDFLIETEIELLNVLDKFSIGIILKSHSVAHFGDELTALTDLKDFERNQGLQSVLQDSSAPGTVDELDQMDTTDGLGEKENQDLRQLEKWSKPVPNAQPGPETNSNRSDDEIQRVDTHDHPTPPIEIGNEPAPDDGTSAHPQTAPNVGSSEAPIESVPAPPAPDSLPAAPADAPPPQVDSLGPSIDSSIAPSGTPPPLQDMNPLPTDDPFTGPSQ